MDTARTFFSCAAFSSSLYPSKISASAAKISDAWKIKINSISEEGDETGYLVTFNLDFRHDIR